MANNFAEAFLGARNRAQDRVQEQRVNDFNMEQAQLKASNAQEDRANSQLVNMARGWKTVQPANRQAYYERFIKPALTQQYGDPGPYDEAGIDSVADQILAAYGGTTPGGAVQSTFIDDRGNRVAIMRDGSTQILGQNAPSNQIIDTGNGFYGVNRGNLQAAPVMIGGGQQQRQTQIPAGGSFMGPDGIPVQMDPGMDPAVRQAIMANPSSWAGAPDGSTATLPAQQAGQQLRSAPKADAQETFSQPQAVTGPDGQIRYVQFGNRGGTREVQGYSAPPTDRDAKPPTEGERTSAGYLQRMEAAEQQLEGIVGEGYEPGNLRDQYTAGQGLLNFAASPLGRRYRQQQEDWVRAKLRKESGAVIGDEEMAREISVYFPQPGDDPGTIRQKAQSRQNAIQQMRISAARAAQPAASQVARPTTDAEYNALPSGALFIDPDDGKQYRKP